MNIKQIIKKNLTENNLFTVSRLKRMRKELVNTKPTFLCPNCIGGILFHDLGLQFRSPTVNLMMYQTDFAKFVLNIDYYLGQELVFFNTTEFTCPCAHLNDITIHFTHYANGKEASDAWVKRSSRIDKENLFIFLEERDGITIDDIKSLSKISARGLVVFTANNYPDIPYALQIQKYQKAGEVGNILRQSYFDGHHEYEKYFDFVKWFNEANGTFDISPFVR